MVRTTPFQVVTGTEIKPKQPIAHLYQHIRQRDPKLVETLDALSKPASLESNLANPLQVLTFGLANPVTNDQSPWIRILSDAIDDKTLYFPILINGVVRLVSSTDVELDFLVSHDGGSNFISLLVNPFVIPSGQHIPVDDSVVFAQGSYLRNKDIAYMQFLSAAFDGTDINCDLMFQ